MGGEDRIWRYVVQNWKSLQDAAPDGCEAVVEVFLVGRAEPLRLSAAHSRDDLPFVMLVSVSGSGTPTEGDSFVFVTEPYVQRVEITLRRIETQRSPIGFSLGELDIADD